MSVQDLPSELSNLRNEGIESCINIPHLKLGKSILLAIFYLKSFIPSYSYICQMLKTKFILTKKKNDSFNNFYSQDLSVLEDPSFLSFLSEFGDALINVSDVSQEPIKLETLSRDLNIKLRIYNDGVLILETSSYEFSPPVPVYLNMVITKDSQQVNYILLSNEININKFNVSQVAQNLEPLKSFSKSLSSLFNTNPASKGLKDWAEKILNDFGEEANKFDLIKSIQNAKKVIKITGNLKTSNRSFHELQNLGYAKIDESRFFKKFAPLPVGDPLKDLEPTEEESDTDSESDDEESIKRKTVICTEPTNEPIQFDKDSPPWDPRNLENVNFSETGDMPASSESHVPQMTSGTSSNEPHCDKCRNNPIDLEIFLECRCKLSYECFQESLVTRICLKCNKQVSEQKYSELKLYFDL